MTASGEPRRGGLGRRRTDQASGQRRAELRALSGAAFEEIAAAPAAVQEVHRAVARRAFGAVGPSGRSGQVLHDAIAGGVYATLGAAAGLAGRGADAALRHRPVSGPPLSATPGGSVVLGVLQGLQGDVLEAEGSPLAQPMAVRVDGHPVAPEPAALAAAFGAGTPRLVVFLHGLMQTERSWRHGGGPTYGDRLAPELGTTPLDVRYNSGRHVSENGASLSALLEALVAAWPVDVEEIALVGHSMGGLVARSACFHAAGDGARWVARVRHVVSLGTPHLGAPLEQAVHYASAALHLLPETRPAARFLRRRSAGIRDLRHGSLVDEDWRDRHPDGLRAAACREIPLLDGTTHCFVSATVTRSPTHPVGRLVGDWFVLSGSATGRGRTRSIPFRDEDGFHVGPASHFALLNHPAVYERLREWLADGR